MRAANPTRGKVYTTDPDYDDFFGTPYEAVYFDWSIGQYRRMVCMAPKTPRDRVKGEDRDLCAKDQKPKRQQNCISVLEKPEPWMKLRALLREQGPMTSKQLAEVVGVIPSNMSRWLGRRKHGIVDVDYSLEHLAPLYGVDPAWDGV